MCTLVRPKHVMISPCFSLKLLYITSRPNGNVRNFGKIDVRSMKRSIFSNSLLFTNIFIGKHVREKWTLLYFFVLKINQLHSVNEKNGYYSLFIQWSGYSWIYIRTYSYNIHTILMIFRKKIIRTHKFKFFWFDTNAAMVSNSR